MILADTSVWIDHFRVGSVALSEALEETLVLTHPFVIGELACGNVKNRRQTLAYLELLPLSVLATHEEALKLIGDEKLSGCGIGWIDVHLLASALISGCRLWTLDRQLNQAAARARVRLYRPN